MKLFVFRRYDGKILIEEAMVGSFPLNTVVAPFLGTIEVTEPKKPKKIVTKDRIATIHDVGVGFTISDVVHPHAKNIRILYDIEE
jgi:hypothetical protein